MRHAGWALVCVACANNVAFDEATGPDGKLKGAKPVVVADGQASAKGIVTYPGGDRIDWKMIELPSGKRGKLDLQLTWQAPRPGLLVDFDVFDELNQPVKATKASATKRMRMQTIDDASGKYFVRIYAPRRGDAGKYSLRAEFALSGLEDEATKLQARLAAIPDPPRLPAVPDPTPVCDVFDVANKACRDKCDAAAPPGWPGCAEQERQKQQQAAAAAAAAAAAQAAKNRPKPIAARIIDAKTVASSSQVTLAVGTDHAPQLDTTWTAEVLNAQTGKPIVGGTLVLVRVGKTQTLAKSNLTIDQLGANPKVKLSPPPSP